MKLKLLIIIGTLLFAPAILVKPAFAFGIFGPSCNMECGSSCCRPLINKCQNSCICISNAETGTASKFDTTIGHVTNEFQKHRTWMVDAFFRDDTLGDPAGLLAAIKLMTHQFTANSMQQVQIIGTFFDAKHQLETQRMFQMASARAHKKYQPSTAFCSFGTMTTSLATASRKTDFTSTALARRSSDRQLFSGDGIGVKGAISDQLSRLQNYILNFCDPNDNSTNNDYLCKNGRNISALYNKDILYSKTIQDPWTLDIDLTDNNNTDDERALFALTDNLAANDLYPYMNATSFVDENGAPAYETGAQVYMDARSVVAKRSVAVNSFASIAALKAASNDRTEPFIYALIQEMGGTETTLEEIQDMIGKNPSYYAQMKVLSKLFFQRPEFYSDLYDKPENVKRLNASIQATKLMRKRDLYRSYLRTEMTMAVMLEAELEHEIRLIENEISKGDE